MLCRIADNRNENDSDKHFRQTGAFGHRFDRSHENLGKDRDADRRSYEQSYSCRQRHRWFFTIVRDDRLLVELPVRDEDEHELHHINQKHQDRDNDAEAFKSRGQAALRKCMGKNRRDGQRKRGKKQHA